MPPKFSLDDESKPLSRQWEDGSSFQQQGQLDWVNLAKTSISFSFGILARLSAASVDSYTITVGHFIGGSFQLSRNGRANVEGALSKLRSFGSLSDALWFGFGLRHPVRSLSITEQGATLVALCAALAESFPDNTSAEILYEIIRCRTDSTSTPSLSQWRTLIKCCAGTFAVTEFPTTAEAFMAMQEDQLSASVMPTEPKALANALLGIGKVSRGEWTAIEISGGREAGWLAAISEWLFHLSISITNESGILQYKSCSANQTPQVTVRYAPSSTQPNQNSYQPSQNNSQVSVVKKTFYLNSIEILVNGDGTSRRDNGLPVSGRVEWNKCLSASFGRAYTVLQKLNTTVGTVIGSAARMFEAISHAEEDVPFEFLEQNSLYMDAAFGSGFLQTALIWLPELSHFEDNMESASTTRTFTDAKGKYETHLAMLATACECVSCDSPDTREGFAPRLCLVALVETIIVLCRLLATIECIHCLCPHRLGLNNLYQGQVRKYRQEIRAKVPFLRVFLPPEHYNKPARLADALCLFTGREMSEMDE